MENLIKIGLITKPHGVRGEVKVNPLTDDITRFSGLKKVVLDGKEQKVISAKVGDGVVFLALFGVTDRNVAEALRGKYIFVSREDAIPLEEDSFFIDDILGCELYAEDLLIGKIIDVTLAKTDIFTIKTVDDRVMRFPFLKDLLISVNVFDKKVTVKKQRLMEVSCYEN